MTSTGIFIRRMVSMKASFHCVGFSLSTRPERSAATKTPVPAVDNQLIVNRAASAFAFTGATGGIRCTRLCSAGMSQTGSDSEPLNVEPSSVVVNVIPENRLLRDFLNSGTPHSAQQAIRITHGIHA